MSTKFDFNEFIKENGKCCCCGEPLKDSKFVNMLTIDKYIQWQFPGWGNVLAKEEEKRSLARAIAVACDNCVKPEKKRVQKVKHAIEVAKIGDTYEIYYHDVEKLKDAPPIIKKDLII